MDRTEAKKGINKFGFRFGISLLLIVVVELLAVAIISPLLADKGTDVRVLASFGLTIFAVDVVGFTSAFCLCKKLPKGELEHEKLGVKRFILGIPMVAGICMVGMLIGLPLHLLVTVPFGVSLSDGSTIGTLMMNSTLLPRVITVGILAPIFEELIFRKILVDRLSYYSKYMAVLVSGIVFGLFHGNFQQCFFAMGLGWFFAYIYAKTGNIKYTIAYHMIVNMTTSVITMYLSGRYMDALSKVDMAALQMGQIKPEDMQNIAPILAYVGYLVLLFIIGVIGIILLLVNKKKMTLQPVENELPKAEAKKSAFRSIGLWLAYGACIIMFMDTYVPNMLHPMVATTVSEERSEVVSIVDGEFALESVSIPLEVTEAGSGQLSVEIQSEDGDSHFITGVVLRKPNGDVDRSFSAGTMTGTFEENLQQGTYQVEVYFLTNPEDYKNFSKTYFAPEDGDDEGPDADFYKDGNYLMNYKFSMTYKVHK